jgi:hypothetical protein
MRQTGTVGGHYVFYPTTSRAGQSAPMLRERKTWIFASELNTRLDELLTLLGCPHEIAPIDANSFGKGIVEITTQALHREDPAMRSSLVQRVSQRLSRK